MITSIFDHKLSFFSTFKWLLETLRIHIVLEDNQKVYVDDQVFVFVDHNALAPIVSFNLPIFPPRELYTNQLLDL